MSSIVIAIEWKGNLLQEQKCGSERRRYELEIARAELESRIIKEAKVLPDMRARAA